MIEYSLITILHIDDNDTNRYVVNRMLRNAGFNVVEAATGEAGLQALEQARPDLIILDVQLPDTNGFEVTLQLKANPATASIPILLLSASLIETKDKAQGLESGADAYLIQPVEAIELIATLKALLRMRQAEESALALAHEWQTTFDAMNDGVCLLNREGRVLRYNRAMMEFLSKPPGEIQGCLHQEVMQARIGSTEVTLFNRVQETRQRESRELQLGDRWFCITIDPIFEGDGVFTGAVYIVADITDRRRAQDSLRFLAQASTLLAASLDYEKTLQNVANLTVPQIADWCLIDMLEADGSIRRLAISHQDSAQVELLWKLTQGYPNEINVPMGVSKVIKTKVPECVAQIPDALGVASEWDDDHWQLLREWGWHSYIIVPLLTDGRVLGAMTWVTADSGRRYSQADLSLAEDLARRAAIAVENARLYREAQEANRMKDEFLATLSHELRSPLNAMLGWLRLLNTRKFDEVTTAKAMETIERSARSQAQLVEDLLDVSRIIRGKLRLNIRPIELVCVIEAALEVVRPAAEAKGIQLQSVLNPSAGPVAGDSGRLQQIVWNLLSNAIKFTPTGGRVRVQLERIDSHVELTVADTGKGIKPEFVPYVFERFRQADSSSTRVYNGLGLGLAIVRQLVELHGGTVRAYSPGEDKGATFTVKLPLIPAVCVEVNNFQRVHSKVGGGVPFERTPSLDGVRAIVVDDEADSREYIIALLEQCGAEVIALASASEAIEAVSRLKADILISDIGMPEEDGYSLICKVRALRAEQGGLIPAVALTAYARAEDRTRAIAAGFQMHIPKPVEPAELATVVASLARRI